MSPSERALEELLKQKQNLEPLLEISPSAIVITDLDSNVVAWNPAAEQLFGYSAGEAIGRNLDDLVAKTEELHRAAEAYSRRTLGKEEIRTVTRRTRKDGTLVDVEVRGAPLLADGEPVGTFGIYHDVTELHRQRRFYEALLDVSPAAIVAIDPQDHVTLWNPAAERLFGYTAEEATARKVDDLVARDEEIRDEAERLNRTAEGGQIRMVTRRNRKDGSLVDVELLGAPVLVGDELVGRYAIYLDISELQRRKQYYEALVELSPTAITTVDPDDKVTSWNPAAERLFGYTAEEAIGRNIDDLVTNRDDLHDEGVRVSEDITEHHVQLTTRRTRKDSSLVDVAVTAAPIFVGGELVGKYALYHDISEIQRQKHFYQSVLELSPTAIITVDEDFHITSWNPGAEKLFGYGAEEATGRFIDDLVANSPDLREEAAANNEAGYRGDEVRAIARRTRKDGFLVDVEVVAAPVYVGGERVGHSVIYHDISEIQRQKRYYEALLDVSPTAIVTVVPEGESISRVTSWNPAAEQLFGFTAEEAIGRNLDDLVAPTTEMREEASRITRAGLGGERTRFITRRARKDGALVDVELLGANVVVGGERVADIVIYHDISEIQRQKRYYEALFQSSPVAICLLETGGKVTSWNPAAEKLFGYTAAEAVGRNIDDLVATSEEVRAEAMGYTELGSRGELAHAITRRTRKDGSLVDVELLAVPVTIGGEQVGYYTMYHYIGELQQAKRAAEAATRAKSAFLATMSHEIRTPLNAVIGMTGLLLDTDLSPEQRGFGEVIRGSGDALLTVINEILDFSKIEAGRVDLERQPFRLRQCVESALELVATAAADKSLDLAYVIDPRTPASIVGDFTRLRQILLNLLNNAVKFTNRGEVVLEVDAAPISSPGDGGAGRYEVHFTVRDTGIGIPEDRMDRLFDAFTQVDASTTRRYGGTGLGLAISKRLAQEMGGRMWAESRVGQGSTFHVEIEVEAAAGPVAEELEAIPELGGKRVLIVDDNSTNREILRRQAESWGMVPQEAVSPKEAIEYVRRGDPFDLAILDMQMPEMDGQALATEIRRHRDAEALPLVMLTSLGRRETSPSDVEFAAYLTKPIRPSQLYDALIGIFAPRMTLHKVARPEAPAVAPPEERPQLRILLAEDNAVNQRVALLLLEKLGYRADLAADGREALQALERQPYDVVLMDVQMPEMDGLEATRKILERWPGPDRPRIIAMTAGATEADREACLAAGMDDYVSKPIRREELAAALARSAPADGGPDGAGRETAAAVDADALDQLRRTVGGEEALEEVMTTFLEDTERILAALRIDADAGRAAEVRRHAHSLKSTAASFGASHLFDLCRRLEDLGRAGRLEGATALIEDMAAEFARVRQALRPGSDR